MTHLLPVLLFGLAAAPAVTPAKVEPTKPPAKAPAPGAWTTFTTEKGGFRASFPATPREDSTNENTSAGPTNTLTYSVALNGSYLAISVTLFAEGTVSHADPEKVLAGARDGAVKKLEGTLLNDKSVTVEGPRSLKRSFPGREYEAKASNGLRVSARLILVGDRLYQLIYVRQGEANDPFKKLVSSFALLGGP